MGWPEPRLRWKLLGGPSGGTKTHYLSSPSCEVIPAGWAPPMGRFVWPLWVQGAGVRTGEDVLEEPGQPPEPGMCCCCAHGQQRAP